MKLFIKSTILLIIGGFITKILGMIIKIIITRNIGLEGLGIYMMIMPTFSLFIGLCQFGLPIAIAKLVSENKSNNKNILILSTFISISIDIIIIVLILTLSKFISNNLLHDIRTYYPLKCICLVLPFISISSIIRAYFFGKQKMLPHVISNIIEDIIRLIILLIGIPIFISKGIIYAVCFLVLSNIISEISSIIVLYFFLPKKINITKNDFNLQNIKNIYRISIPTVITRLIGNIGYFLEPIILTNTLLYIGYSNEFITNEYGIIQGYVIPLLTLPTFFTNAISNSLLPNISNAYSKNKNIKSKIKQGLFISLFIGIFFTIIFMFFSKPLLNIIYNTNLGLNYIKVLAPIFLLLYIQSTLSSILQAINLTNKICITSLMGILVRTISLFLFSLLKIGLWGLIFSIIINLIFITGHYLIYLKKYIFT